MRKMLLLSAAFFGFTAGAFAQNATSPVPAVPPMTAPGAASQVPPGAMAPAMGAGQMAAPMHNGMKGMAATAPDPDIRPGHVPGVGDSFPTSNKASNVTPGNTHSVIAPRLPSPAGGPNAGVNAFLTDAQRALSARQTGRAQEALERAETAMLQRSVPADQASAPDQTPGVMRVQAARDALAKGDIAGAQKAIADAMSAG
jgi:hypothetical protein